MEQEKLSAAAIRSYLKNPGDAEKLLIFDELDSTNTEAKRQILNGAPHGTVILAEQQSAGRGRMGRSFYSPHGSGVYFSMILRPKMPISEVVGITTAASVGVSRAIETVIHQVPAIKWVNDLYLDNKKICGILTEALNDAVIVGVGVNCTTVFEGELATIAGSLSKAGIRNHLAAELVNELSRLETMVKTKDYLDTYRRCSMVLGKEITVLQEEGSRYLAEDIGEKGELVLRDANGNQKILQSGEISIRLAE